ncbi:enolase C-terminal domain-like protein [Actinomadura sp. HBU206391]|uniref:enolase C-terminal domain-like protein n=1 Tax=Actinomadura sp. HBU206391 TaxID=2731692 RepID=UPI00164F20EA|nr:enolase C-terminal domain-like protein [Actinomadura sp. HBU206391]MBC6462338.1 hypothetical protein [Actinomadura sp. HBU206391]
MIRLVASAYTIPTDAPEADGTLEWTSTTLVLVEASSEESVGIGWTYGPAVIAGTVTALLEPEVRDVDVMDPPAAHERMCRAIRNAGRPGICSMAVSAVDCALWDLKVRQLDLPLHRLFGAVQDRVPVYGSGGFTTYDTVRMREQFGHWTGDQGIPRVKIKIGEAWGSRESRDLERLRLARDVTGADAELYADANGGYSAKQAIRVAAAAADLDIRWLEEPVSSDDLPGLLTVRNAVRCEVAAGEYGYDLPSGSTALCCCPRSARKPPAGLRPRAPARMRAEGHHGTLDIEDSPRGARFVLRLPLLQDQALIRVRET